MGAGLLSAKSGRIKDARKLTRRSVRAERRVFLAEGAKALAEAVLVPGCVVEVLATEEATAAEEGLRARVIARGISWELAEPEAVDSLAGSVNPQGIVAVCRFVDRPVEDLLDRAARRTLAVCADVRDPGNAGTVFRTADATGTGAVLLAGNSVDPYNDKTVRASVGSLFHVPIGLAGDPVELVVRLQRAGYVVLAADGGGEAELFGPQVAALLGGPVAWLFGNEAWGLPAELAAAADHRVGIPIYGHAESLNLSTAAALCLYESARAAHAGH